MSHFVEATMSLMTSMGKSQEESGPDVYETMTSEFFFYFYELSSSLMKSHHIRVFATHICNDSPLVL